MVQEELNQIVKEIRREHGIPPFFEDEDITSLLREGKYRLDKLVGVPVDYDIDFKARMLLKTYVFYSFNQKVEEFMSNYREDILGLQFDYVPNSNENE